MLNGENVGGYRAHGDEDGARRYTLTHIENISHALAASGGISGLQHLHVLKVVQAVAEVYGLSELE